MSDKTVGILRRITGIALCAAILLCAVACIVSCVGIYRSGDRPFTPDSVSQAFEKIAIFFVLTIIFTAAAGVLHLLYPAPAKKEKGTVYPEIRLAKIKARLARKQYSEQLLLPLKKQEGYVKFLRASVAVVGVLCAVYPLIYLNNLDNFTSIDAQLNAQVLSAVIPSLCFAFAALAYALIVRLLCDRSCEGAILYAKTIMLLPAPAAEKKPSGKQESGLPGYTTFVLRIVLLTLAAVMIVLGIFNGGVGDVLQKAIKICTECIGLG